MKDKYYSIGKVSEICNIPIKTLRYYDKINVMVPNLRQENNNYRYYHYFYGNNTINWNKIFNS